MAPALHRLLPLRQKPRWPVFTWLWQTLAQSRLCLLTHLEVQSELLHSSAACQALPLADGVRHPLFWSHASWCVWCWNSHHCHCKKLKKECWSNRCSARGKLKQSPLLPSETKAAITFLVGNWNNHPCIIGNWRGNWNHIPVQSEVARSCVWKCSCYPPTPPFAVWKCA